LVDFLTEFTNLPNTTEWPKNETWVIYVDGSSTKKYGRAGMVLITPKGEEFCSSLKLEFKTTNNKAEYEAVLAGLGLAHEMGANSIEIRSNLQVIVSHIQGEFEAKGDTMELYLARVQDMQSSFKRFNIRYAKLFQKKLKQSDS
jgi:ribonuclease HI